MPRERTPEKSQSRGMIVFIIGALIMVVVFLVYVHEEENLQAEADQKMYDAAEASVGAAKLHEQMRQSLQTQTTAPKTVERSR